jgi:hypothetical protein
MDLPGLCTTRILPDLPGNFKRSLQAFVICLFRQVEMSLVDRKLVASVVEPALTLEHLLAQVTEDNLHREVDTGQALGKEFPLLDGQIGESLNLQSEIANLKSS